MVDKLTKDTTLGEAVSKYPETASIMLKYGLHCIGCHVATWETIEAGAKGHGLTDAQVKDMLAEMNSAVSERENALKPGSENAQHKGEAGKRAAKKTGKSA